MEYKNLIYFIKRIQKENQLHLEHQTWLKKIMNHKKRIMVVIKLNFKLQ